jgi:DNA (cytosine-5)-methyltransferase 1
MRYLSVCSGIEAASVAWHDLFQCAAMSEIEPFPRAVLEHHYPSVPLHGDFTTIEKDDYGTIDILVGGTPCQSFSVAGLRGGLDDDRGNLALEFCRLAFRKRPRWVLWENVPGCLSANGGRDFGSILGGLAECGYGFAYRVLDAQFVRVESHPFAVPQRRRRVFVVGYLGDWRPSAAVLFERESLRRHSPPRREARTGNPAVSHALLASANKKWCNNAETYITLKGDTVASTLNHRYDSSPCTDRGQDVVAYQCQGSNAGPMGTLRAGNGNSSGGVPFVPLAGEVLGFSCKDYGADVTSDVSPTMRSMGHHNSHANGGGQLAIAFAQNQRNELREMSAAGALSADPGVKQQSYVITGTDKTNRVAFETDVSGAVRTRAPGQQENSSTTVAAQDHMVRRLTPTECERLQGFPDGYTDVIYRGKKAADGPRYKAIGNSMAVNVMRWIGLRIQQVDAIVNSGK